MNNTGGAQRATAFFSLLYTGIIVCGIYPIQNDEKNLDNPFIDVSHEDFFESGI